MSLSLVLQFLLFALAVFGHACLLMVMLNVVYSQPYHKKFLSALRALAGLVIWGGPIAFAYFQGIDVLAMIRNAALPGEYLLAGYLVLALVMACVLFPIATIRRRMRRLPVGVHEVTTILDVVKELGNPPWGDGPKMRMARRPLNDIFHVDFTTLTITRPDLPAEWDGLTLLQLSDLHFFGTPSREFFDCVVRRCLSDGVPDLLMITGDIVDDEPYLAWIEPILAPLRWKIGAFAILGNHDWWQDFDTVRQNFRNLGIHVVSNSWEQIDVRGRPMTVIGHEGPWFRPAPDLSKCPAEGFRVLLSHTPDNIRWAKRNGVSLVLSGHNHGGQIRVPFFGSIFVPSKYSRRYDEGTFFESPTFLHVNRGLSGKAPYRLFCRPQVTRLILKRG